MGESKFRLPAPKYWSNINKVMDLYTMYCLRGLHFQRFQLLYMVKHIYNIKTSTRKGHKHILYWTNQRRIYKLLCCEVDSSRTRKKSLYNFCIWLFRKRISEKGSCSWTDFRHFCQPSWLIFKKKHTEKHYLSYPVTWQIIRFSAIYIWHNNKGFASVMS